MVLTTPGYPSVRIGRPRRTSILLLSLVAFGVASDSGCVRETTVVSAAETSGSTTAGLVSTAGHPGGSTSGSGEVPGSDTTQDPGGGPGGIPGGTGVPGNPGGGKQPDSSSSAEGIPTPEDSTQPGQPEKGDSSSPDSEAPDCVAGETRLCQETPSGEKVQFPTGAPVGACKMGTQKCDGGKWASCIGVVGPQAADRCDVAGDDSDCNGVANDGCDCVDGESRPCGESNQGECRMGEQSCVGGKWSDECKGAVFPDKERCDGAGKDEDCDGRPDLDDDQCECIDDSFEYCTRNAQKGDCKVGRRTCVQGRWGACTEWAKPEPEKCGKRAPVSGVEWSRDENCDGDVDLSPLGRKGPVGCVRMMLDRDGDGYGAIGLDLSEVKSKNQVSQLATACLCKERPDISDKVREGWVDVNGKQNQDCGDCSPGLGGEKVYPGSSDSSLVSNRCLEHVGWRVGSPSNPMKGDFDLNCDGKHTDPTDRAGIVGVIKCVPNEESKTCSYAGKGRLIPQGQRGIWCGGTFDVGACIPKFGQDGEGFPDPTFSRPQPGKRNRQMPTDQFLGCDIKSTGERHTIRCQ